MNNELVYCISLEKNKHNWDDIIRSLKRVGFPNTQIFQAINGRELDEQYKQSIVSVWTYYFLQHKLPRRYHAQPTTWGAIGCYLSHVSLWYKLIQSNAEYMIIFEDDVQFNQDFDVSQLVLPPDFDLFFLDVLWEQNPSKITKDKPYREIQSAFFGTHAYIITRKCAEMLLDFAFPIEIQIDSFIYIIAERLNLKVYVSNKKLCDQGTHQSTIQTGFCMTCYPYIPGNFIFKYLAFGIILLCIIYILKRKL